MLFTSESVTEGHPDKICDQISDAVLDACLAQDPQSRVACEVATKTGFVMLMGEITSQARIDLDQIARQVLLDIGYNDSRVGLDGNTCGVLTAISKQSPDIAQGVDSARDQKKSFGAGDQGLMFGYACRETENLMPLPIELAHKLTKALSRVRKIKQLDWLRPDGKSQVTVEYDDQGQPKRIKTVLVSAQHSPDISQKEIRQALIDKVIMPQLPADLIDRSLEILVNPTGRFVIGGPVGDAGMTGRKIMVDTYGGMARHGGGAFSGKDATKVDRSAAYALRRVAKTIVAKGMADRCEVQVAYAIGLAKPISIAVDTFRTGKVDDREILAFIKKKFDLRPEAIIEDLDLRRPIFSPLATYGHIGREDLGVKWETVLD